MSIDRMIVTNELDEGSRTIEIGNPDWSQVQRYLTALENQQSITMFPWREEPGLFVRLTLSDESFLLFYSYADSHLPERLRSCNFRNDEPDPEEPPVTFRDFFIMDARGALAAAGAYFNQNYLYETVDWENI